MLYVYKALQKSFASTENKLIALSVFMLGFLISIWANNIFSLLGYFSLETSLSQKALYLIKYTISTVYEMSWFTLLYSSLLFMLLSINTVLFIHIYKTARHAFGKAHIVTTSGIGFLVSLIGVGCFSCGAFLLTYILSIFGLGSIIVLLPFKGAEVIIFGFALLFVSIYVLSKKLVALSE